MRQFAIGFGLGLLAALPAVAGTGLRVEVAVRDMTPGAHVWMEVRPEYGQIARPAGGQDFSAMAEAAGESVWQFDVPASGKTSTGHDFEFPLEIDRSSSADHVGVIHLRTRFRIDGPQGEKKTGYGDTTEVTLAMPVLPGTAALSRCLRLREAGNRLTLESAADCLDASFVKSRKLRLHDGSGSR